MLIRINSTFPSRPHRDTMDYFDGNEFGKRPRVREFREQFSRPMRIELEKRLAGLRSRGAETVLEIGPGEGCGSDIALRTGFRNLELVEVNPTTVEQLRRKYETDHRDGSILIHQGDVRDVLTILPSKSSDVSIIFDNTLSNMQEPNATLDGVKEDFRIFVIREMLRLARKSVVIGITGSELTDVYMTVFGQDIVWTSNDRKSNVFRDGAATTRYDELDVRELMLKSGVPCYRIEKTGSIYWVEVEVR